MALIGEGTQAGLAKVDYSPYIRGAWNQANQLSAGFDRAGKRIKRGLDEAKENKGAIADAISKAEALGKLNPELADSLAGTIEALKDEETPLSQRGAMGRGVVDTIELGLGELQARAGRDVAREYLSIAQSDSDIRSQAFEAELPHLAAGFDRERRMEEIALQNAEMQSGMAFDELESARLGREVLAEMGPQLLRDTYKAASESGAVGKGILSDAKNAFVASPEKQAKMAQVLQSLLPDSSAPELKEIEYTTPEGTVKAQTYWNGSAFVPVPVEIPPSLSADASGVLPQKVPAIAVDKGSELDALKTQKAQLEVEKLQGEKQAKAEAAAAQREKTARSIQLVDAMINHPGLPGAVGASITNLGVFGEPKIIPGTKEADFETMREQLEAINFTEAVAALKGMGSLSDAEGKKLAAAAGRLNRRQSNESFKKSLREIKEVLESAQRKLNGGQAPPPAPAPQASPNQDIEDLRALGIQ